MQDRASERLGVIDFQDAVIGAYTYDLASLLRDAYINFDENWVTEQLACYHQLAQIDKNLADFTLDFNVMSLQRHLKVLGIFVRLFVRDGKEGYLKDLPRVMWYLRQELKACPALTELQQFIENEVVPAFTDVYGEYHEVSA